MTMTVQSLDFVRPLECDHHELLKNLQQYIKPEAKSADTSQGKEADRPEAEAKPFRRQIVWFPNALGFLILHIVAVYGTYLGFTQVKILTFIWVVALMHISCLGVTMGAHRLFSHKAFKAKTAVKVALILLQTLAGQNCLYIWVRDHRLHHKHSDTDADPHNARRGFFFSHIGWLMCRKHPDVIAKGKTIDLSDLEEDPFVMFQKKYYKTLYFLISFGLPVVVPIWLWGEDPFISVITSFITRTVISLNLTWLVNSAAHKFGNKPFTRDIVPVDCQYIAIFALGEGWHNYHHTFPWDYKAAELGQSWNATTVLLDMMARWGWVYDLRQATPAMVLHRIQQRGDGSHRWSKAPPASLDGEPLARHTFRSSGSK